MRFKRSIRHQVSLESIALTDIVMNLFLFFFVTFSLYSTFQIKRESPLKVNLPHASEGANLKLKAEHEILLTKSGEILWDEIPVQIKELRERLVRQENKKSQIALRADRDGSVQSLVSILETIRAAGATNVSLQTELKQSAT